MLLTVDMRQFLLLPAFFLNKSPQFTFFCHKGVYKLFLNYYICVHKN